MTRIERISRVLFYRDKEGITWKFMGTILKIPAGACERIYRSGKIIQGILNTQDPNLEPRIKYWMNAKFGALGKIRDDRTQVSNKIGKKLAKVAGLETFRLNGKLYLHWRS